VQAATVAVDEPPRRGCDQIAQRRDAVLERHTSRLNRHGLAGPSNNHDARG
jgi:hypothetical protein